MSSPGDSTNPTEAKDESPAAGGPEDSGKKQKAPRVTKAQRKALEKAAEQGAAGASTSAAGAVPGSAAPASAGPSGTTRPPVAPKQKQKDGGAGGAGSGSTGGGPSGAGGGASSGGGQGKDKSQGKDGGGGGGAQGGKKDDGSAGKKDDGSGAGKKENASEAKVPSKKIGWFSHLPEDFRLTKAMQQTEKESIHPDMLAVGLKIASRDINGPNARCMAMLIAFRSVVSDYKTPPNKRLAEDLVRLLKGNITFLVLCRPLCISMGNAIKFLKDRITNINKLAKLPERSINSTQSFQSTQGIEISEERAKSLIFSVIDTYIQDRIVEAMGAVANLAEARIQNGDVLLTFGNDSTVLETFRLAHARGKSFRVVVVDSRPSFEGVHLLRKLDALGIPCTYIQITAIAVAMVDVTKVIAGCDAIFSNGYVKANCGTAMIAMAAKRLSVPFLVLCETAKFSEKNQLDSITDNELSDPEKLANAPTGPKSPLESWHTMNTLKILNLVYDLTPVDLVTAVITEIGMIPPTSVPVIIREYRPELSGV